MRGGRAQPLGIPRGVVWFHLEVIDDEASLSFSSLCDAAVTAAAHRICSRHGVLRGNLRERALQTRELIPRATYLLFTLLKVTSDTGASCWLMRFETSRAGCMLLRMTDPMCATDPAGAGYLKLTSTIVTSATSQSWQVIFLRYQDD